MDKKLRRIKSRFSEDASTAAAERVSLVEVVAMTKSIPAPFHGPAPIWIPRPSLAPRFSGAGFMSPVLGSLPVVADLQIGRCSTAMNPSPVAQDESSSPAAFSWVLFRFFLDLCRLGLFFVEVQTGFTLSAKGWTACPRD